MVKNNHDLLDTPIYKVFPILKIVGLGKDKEDAVEEGNKQALIADDEKGHDHHHDEHHKHSHKKKKFATEGDTLD